MNICIASQTACFLLTVGLFFSASAQSGMTPVAASGFQLGGDWKTVTSVQMHPEKADFVKSKTDSQAAIILGRTGARATVQLGAGDLTLKLDFMLAKNSEALLKLPNGYAIKLIDSWGDNTLTNSSCGSIGELAPQQNTAKAPGLWQNLTVQFRPPAKNKAAQIEKMMLNGIIIHENAFLNAPPTTETALTLEVTKGVAAFKNVLYQLLNDTRPIRLQNLSYRYYKGWAETVEQINPANLVKKDTTSIITHEWGLGEKNYYVIYEGQINATEAGEYTFSFPFKVRRGA